MRFARHTTYAAHIRFRCGNRTNSHPTNSHGGSILVFSLNRLLILTMLALIAAISACAREAKTADEASNPDPGVSAYSVHGVKVHFVPTVHWVPADRMRADDVLPEEVHDLILQADKVFLEVDPEEPFTGEEFVELIHGDREAGRPPIGSFTDEWSPTTEAAFSEFVDDLAARADLELQLQQVVYGLRPHAVSSILNDVAFQLIADNDQWGIDNAIKQVADRAGVPVGGLQNSAESTAIFDRADQSAFVEHWRLMAEQNVSVPDYLSANETLLELGFEAWRSGKPFSSESTSREWFMLLDTDDLGYEEYIDRVGLDRTLAGINAERAVSSVDTLEEVARSGEVEAIVVAVGSDHLLKESEEPAPLVAELRSRGYEPLQD